MKNVAIYGAGGFGREIACLVKEINQQNPDSPWNLIGFFDDGIPIGSANEYGVILGGIDELNNYRKPLAVVMAIGKPAILSLLIGKINNPLVEFPNIIAPEMRYLDKNNLSMGIGNIFFSKCSLSCNVHIGDFNIFNGTISVGHDTTIGNFNILMSGVRLSGEVIIGDLNFFGIYAVVLQQNRIGNNTIIGTGSVVMRNTKDNSTYFGNPAKKFKY